MRRSPTLTSLALAAVTCSLPFAGHSAAQSADAGSLAGIVADANGAVLADATVSATNNTTGQVTTVKSNAKGEYRFTRLVPAPYTVTIEAAGFKTERETNLVIEVGVIASLSPKLQVGGASETVDVAAETSPEMHLDSNEISSVIDQNMIDNLPINGRRASNFALLTPGVVSNGDGFGLLSFRGISFLLNNSTIDGLDDNQAYFSEQRGRTRAAYSISQTAVQEFQVNTSNFSAEYGRSAGGVINTVTKSGGNQFHGELFFYDRDNDFGASNPYTVLTSLNPATGNYVTNNYKPKDWRKQWGFGAGGPILRDKLFFFYSYDQSRRNFPGTATASTATAGTFAPADPTLPAGQTCATIMSNQLVNGVLVSSTGAAITTPYATGDFGACTLAGNTVLNTGTTAGGYQAAAAYYQQGLGVLASFLGPVARNSDQVINFPKLDWQVNSRNHAIFSYNRLRASSPAGIQTQQTNTYGRTSFGNDFIKEDFGIARLATTLSATMTNEIRFQYGRDFEYGSSQYPSGNEVPLSNNQFGTPPDVSIGYDYDAAGFDIGTPLTLQRRALPDERRIQGSDGYTWAHGKNTTKAGLDFNRVFDFIDNLYDENGSYSEDTAPNFLADYYHYTRGLGTSAYKPQYYQFSQGFGTRSGEIATTDYAGYLTNDWRATARLTLTAGVRYEYEYIPPNPYANLTGTSGTFNGQAITLTTPLPQTADRPDDRNNIQPRVGFALDVYGTGKTTLRGGYGIYNGRIINANILQVYLNSGSPNGQFRLSTPSTTTCTTNLPTGVTNGLIFPNIFPSGVQGAIQMAAECGPAAITNAAGVIVGYNAGVQTTAAYLDPHLQNPQVHEIDLAVEQQLGHGTVFALQYMGSLGRELASAVDRNISSLGGTTNETYNVVIPAAVPSTGYTLPNPRGGVAPPLFNGQMVTLKTYTSTAAGSRTANGVNGIYQLLDFKSDVNSSYHALAVQLNHRFSQGFSLTANYTWAHAMDYNPYLSTNDGTNQQLDPNDLSQEYGNSVLNVQQRFVGSGSYLSNFHEGGRIKRSLTNGWRVAAIVQSQTGLPYSTGTSKTAANATYSGIIGAGGIARIPKFDANRNLLVERDNENLPNVNTTDLRLSRSFSMDDRFGHLRLEFLAEAFNLFNHQNITSVNASGYAVCNATGVPANSPLPTTSNYVDPRLVVGAQNCPNNTLNPNGTTTYTLLYNPLFGTNRNSNSNTVYTPRQLQGSIRLYF